MKPEPRFEKGDKVRVVTSDTPFFGWIGEIVTCEEGLELTSRHYLVRMHNWFIEQPLLFREMQLAFAG